MSSMDSGSDPAPVPAPGWPAYIVLVSSGHLLMSAEQIRPGASVFLRRDVAITDGEWFLSERACRTTSNRGLSSSAYWNTMTRGNQARSRKWHPRLAATHFSGLCPLEPATCSYAQRDIDRARAQKRKEKSGAVTQHDKDGLTPQQRRERCVRPWKVICCVSSCASAMRGSLARTTLHTLARPGGEQQSGRVVRHLCK